jgi:phage recombination protein Bet
MSKAKKSKKEVQAIVRVPAAPEKAWLLNENEVAIVKNSIAKGASDQELHFCLTVARRYRLDPFRQQIWFVKRWDKNADNGKGGTGGFVWTPQVGINGLLFAAARDHKADFGSVALPEYGPMFTVEGQGKLKAPEWVRVKVWKKGEAIPTEAEAWWSEYAPADLSKAPFWRNMPRRMLAKCAIALAVRQAYPDLGGLYIPEEMDRMGDDYTPSGRQIVDPNEPKFAPPTQAQLEPRKETITATPWKEGRYAIEGTGLAVLKSELEPEAFAELGILYNSAEKVTHMPVAQWFKLDDRARKLNIEPILNEPMTATADETQPY